MRKGEDRRVMREKAVGGVRLAKQEGEKGREDRVAGMLVITEC